MLGKDELEPSGCKHVIVLNSFGAVTSALCNLYQFEQLLCLYSSFQAEIPKTIFQEVKPHGHAHLVSTGSSL